MFDSDTELVRSRSLMELMKIPFLETDPARYGMNSLK
jgi:hypothetical protein